MFVAVGQIPVTCPGVHDFSAFLLNRAEIYEWSGRAITDFLEKFALRGFEQFFAVIRLAFGNGPITFILFDEKGAARMREKNFNLAIHHTVEDQASADSGSALHT